MAAFLCRMAWASTRPARVSVPSGAKNGCTTVWYQSRANLKVWGGGHQHGKSKAPAFKGLARVPNDDITLCERATFRSQAQHICRATQCRFPPDTEYTYSRSERGLHVLTLTGKRERGQPLRPVTGKPQQVDDFQQVRGHHGDAEVEEAVAEADGALEAAQGLGRRRLHPRRRHCVVVPPICRLSHRRQGGRGGRSSLLVGILQQADVAVALVVHLPGLAEDPSPLNVRWGWAVGEQGATIHPTGVKSVQSPSRLKGKWP